MRHFRTPEHRQAGEAILTIRALDMCGNKHFLGDAKGTVGLALVENTINSAV